MVLSRLHHPEEKSFEQLDRIGLALQCRPPREGRPEGRHVGILFRRQEETSMEVTLLHLVAHRTMQAGSPSKAYSWLELPIPREKMPAVVGLCRVLVNKYVVHREDSIPFGPRYTGGRFDLIHGDFLPEGGRGLTCATFVLAVFVSCGVQLLKAEEWPPRIDDLDWHREILSALRNPQSGATAEEIQAHERETGCPRFRPQEVAAAGAVPAPDELPLGFEEARRIGELLVEALLARGGSTPR